MYNSLKMADDKTRNCGILHGILGGIYSRFYVIATSSCTSWVGVCCHLLNLSINNSTVLGFPDTSEDCRSLNSKCRTQYKWETMPGCTGLIGRGLTCLRWAPPNYYWFCVLHDFLHMCIFLARKLNSH